MPPRQRRRAESTLVSYIRQLLGGLIGILAAFGLLFYWPEIKIKLFGPDFDITVPAGEVVILEPKKPVRAIEVSHPDRVVAVMEDERLVIQSLGQPGDEYWVRIHISNRRYPQLAHIRLTDGER